MKKCLCVLYTTDATHISLNCNGEWISRSRAVFNIGKPQGQLFHSHCVLWFVDQKMKMNPRKKYVTDKGNSRSLQFSQFLFLVIVSSIRECSALPVPPGPGADTNRAASNTDPEPVAQQTTYMHTVRPSTVSSPEDNTEDVDTIPLDDRGRLGLSVKNLPPERPLNRPGGQGPQVKNQGPPGKLNIQYHPPPENYAAYVYHKNDGNGGSDIDNGYPLWDEARRGYKLSSKDDEHLTVRPSYRPPANPKRPLNRLGGQELKVESQGPRGKLNIQYHPPPENSAVYVFHKNGGDRVDDNGTGYSLWDEARRRQKVWSKDGESLTDRPSHAPPANPKRPLQREWFLVPRQKVAPALIPTQDAIDESWSSIQLLINSLQDAPSGNTYLRLGPEHHIRIGWSIEGTTRDWDWGTVPTTPANMLVIAPSGSGPSYLAGRPVALVDWLRQCLRSGDPTLMGGYLYLRTVMYGQTRVYRFEYQVLDNDSVWIPANSKRPSEEKDSSTPGSSRETKRLKTNTSRRELIG